MQTLLLVGFLKILQILKAHKISVLSLYKTSPEPHFRLSIAHKKISAMLPLRRPKIALLYPLGLAFFWFLTPLQRKMPGTRKILNKYSNAILGRRSRSIALIFLWAMLSLK